MNLRPARTIHGTDSWVVPAACFLASSSSGAALLAKVYGVASMRWATLAAALPCCLGLLGAWGWARRSGREPVATALAIGFVGGLLGTLGYDLIRVPMHLAGQRIFAPIGAYGVWIAEASASSRFTDVIGWAYHFSNGITFGIMYALVMRGGHWAWAVLWAFTLETIAVLSPFARIFGIAGNYPAIANAYLAHVAYGVPLGLVVQRWDDTSEYLARAPSSLKWAGVTLGCAALVWPLISPRNVQRDSMAAEGEFRVEGDRLNPGWLRVERGQDVRVYNPGPDSVSVVVRGKNEVTDIAKGQRRSVSLQKPGIYQVHVVTTRRSRSSFVMVEPVEQLD